MFEQLFTYADSTIKEMTDFFETRVESLEPREEKKKKDEKSNKKRIRDNFDTSVVESGEESAVDHRQVKKYSMLQGKCSHTTGNSKDLKPLVNKHKKKKKKYRRYALDKKE